MSNKVVVNALWLGSKSLNPLAMLTLNSFTSHGVEFHLWKYESLKGSLPKGVIVRDGNEILPASRIFRYPEKMLLGFGGGSYVGFSEIFRYKLLYDIGGWWSDMDVTLLSPLDNVVEDYWFRLHGVLSVVGNIMKVPPRSELMRICYERASVEVNEYQDDWHHAIRILAYNIENLHLTHCIHKDVCNLDRLDRILPFVEQEGKLDLIPSHWRFLHWMNSVTPKNYKKDSVLEKLLIKYKCLPRPMLL
jgi:hypothetical protein